MEILTEKLRECRTDYDGSIMPDRAEPIGCDCGLLREAEDEIERLHRSRDFYMRRCEALQAVQDKMRDPERKAVCDILANGSTEAMNGANTGVKPRQSA